eukprot:gnl/TRDRNA2_/TRDRNA2_198436_c0_seq1.p1 gnl/TRDRNA2_/TRDRNA2_198436_c0~~gnl/TRDRNA2_/TRDRNA2_198436_c0_seq1.p1  ORF type:complete len:162 (-),score=22.33 gnl/TRDRNA2_/TRDRNA2_198436_c0_seq1:111-596(-)
MMLLLSEVLLALLLHCAAAVRSGIVSEAIASANITALGTQSSHRMDEHELMTVSSNISLAHTDLGATLMHHKACDHCSCINCKCHGRWERNGRCCTRCHRHSMDSQNRRYFEESYRAKHSSGHSNKRHSQQHSPQTHKFDDDDWDDEWEKDGMDDDDDDDW